MEISVEQFDAILDILQEHEVEAFEGFGFRVQFAYLEKPDSTGIDSKPSPEEVLTVEKIHKKKSESKGIWHDPSLWPDGKPPEFPGK